MSASLPGPRTPEDAPPLPGPVLQRVHIPLLARALGSYSAADPVWFRVDTVRAFFPGLYLVVDAQGRIVWLGMAAGFLGVTGRIVQHRTEPWKRRVFDRVFVAEAREEITRPALEAAEGWAADALNLRTWMPYRTWPASTNWGALVSSRS
ncbi:MULTISPECIES: hypothetical protein [Streptomyces]|uniref:GIY-YIG nuclease family protein n=1 Tax=Streptomyces spinosisporus TaxID=2927582 RepID=A0ABS9XWL8_9ACTN|nr:MULTISPECIES: hypothetical protein [Streptomyces]MCI3246451.1 hypothetical protein [Streptomyces spinosisporus]WUB33390.1 hypothetical protein OHN38_00015 [Streptomyces sp. NBC_00588]WUB41379.1 hypothetical protein OHN38_43285 [Streptomyces sp. NBC_00588]